MQEILIHLSSKQRRVLLGSVPEYSDLWNLLNRAIRPRVWIAAGNSTEYIVICDATAAEALLHFGRKNCRDAVSAIELAIGKTIQNSIRTAGSTPAS
jgi:hypothetical protein